MKTQTNRLTDAMLKVQEKLNKISPEKLKRANKAATVDNEMIVIFQNKQAEAHAQGLLSLDEANYLYDLFGGEYPSATNFNEKSLADRIVGMQAITEIW